MFTSEQPSLIPHQQAGRVHGVDDLWTIWGQNVQKERERAGLSMRQLAQASGTHASQLSRIERGIAGPSDTWKLSIATALDVSPDELFPLSPAA